MTLTVFGLSNYKRWICYYLRWERQQVEEKSKLSFVLTLPRDQQIDFYHVIVIKTFGEVLYAVLIHYRLQPPQFTRCHWSGQPVVIVYTRSSVYEEGILMLLEVTYRNQSSAFVGVVSILCAPANLTWSSLGVTIPRAKDPPAQHFSLFFFLE